MRILILGEGPTDLGRIEADGTCQLEGPLPLLVRKIIAEMAPQKPVEIRAKILKEVRLFPKKDRRMGHSAYGYANKLRLIPGLREGREADAIVAVVDRDGEKNKDKIVELNKGREELEKENKPCAVGLAIEEIEAWLLADEKALRTALNDPSIQRQPDPESLNGHKESKERLQQLIDQNQANQSTPNGFVGLCADIARASEIKALETRCADGFKPFAEQVRELANF